LASGQRAPWLATGSRSRGFQGGVAPLVAARGSCPAREGEERAPDLLGVRGKGETRSGFPFSVDPAAEGASGWAAAAGSSRFPAPGQGECAALPSGDKERPGAPGRRPS
jgi:hypothetical protein